MSALGSFTDHPSADALTPNVTIVVPTHQRPSMLSRLLESCCGLTYPRDRLEVIVVGGARDPGREVVQAFAKRADFPVSYRIVRDDMFGSASFKRNEGARAAHGTVLAFTDDDCMVRSEWLTAAVHLFQAPEVGGVEGAVDIPRPYRPTLTYRGSQRLSLAGGYQTCNMLYRKAVFEECGGFDQRLPYYLEDTDLAYTLMERGYVIPFAPMATVAHPVEPARPLKTLTLATTVERMPYLFFKHGAMRARLRKSVKVFNRSHYLYLALYLGGFSAGLVEPILGAEVLGLGLCALLVVHLVHDFRGLHFTFSELAVTALCYPIVPVLRLFYWLKGLLKLRLGVRAGR